MGIQVEYNPDLALRNISEFKAGNRKEEECIPANLEVGRIYPFLKSGQRNYWLFGEIPLLATKGDSVLSRPKASVIILEASHFLDNDKAYTKGKHKVVEVFNDDKIHFEGFNKL
ncbi:MAG: hypothetical protein WC768_00665 [Patescibacteria group bacterium]|jgi:hypothetical protein